MFKHELEKVETYKVYCLRDPIDGEFSSPYLPTVELAQSLLDNLHRIEGDYLMVDGIHWEITPQCDVADLEVCSTYIPVTEIGRYFVCLDLPSALDNIGKRLD